MKASAEGGAVSRGELNSNAYVAVKSRSLAMRSWVSTNAFTGLASLAQVTLATVAPGIAEALVATAIGLFAAIPAVIGYNRFAHDIDRVANSLETFMEEFSNILQRNLGSHHPQAATASTF